VRVEREGGEVAELLVLVAEGELGVPYLEHLACTDEQREATDPAQLAHRHRDTEAVALAPQPVDDAEGAAHAGIVQAAVLAPVLFRLAAAFGTGMQRVELPAAIADQAVVRSMA
jgi:hypothetical protein